jgi:hypothetical protein
MNEGIVEGGINVSNAEDKFAFCHLRTERDGVFFFRRLDFLGRLESRTLGPSSQLELHHPWYSAMLKSEKHHPLCRTRGLEHGGTDNIPFLKVLRNVVQRRV